MAKGEVILITFPFTDLSGSKLRPSVVLADTGSDVTVAFITPQTKWQEPTDLLLSPTSLNGLKKPSTVRIGKLSTLDKALVKGSIGFLTPQELTEIERRIKLHFQLS